MNKSIIFLLRLSSFMQKVFYGREGSTFVSDNQYIEQFLATASHDFHVYHQQKKEFVQFTLSSLR